ncbi:MAG: tRNA pseudouridine(38-40) synthase TruA [Opitutae bacterium]|jgi:tRNA pseudouridine38-40 synthase|nr:tRNA pseudouridine(38-40) synthase TruA [Opitutae bacterium]
MTTRWRCVCAYDGTGFSGWQKQPSGDAVQDKIETGLKEIFQRPIRTIGAGRTDAGVHAKGQVFHFDAEWKHHADDMLNAMRAHLPVGISPRSLSSVRPNFHAQISAKGKLYRYRCVLGWAMPQEDRFVLSLKNRKLDFEKMKLASRYLIGTHDFSSFAASRGNDKYENPVRTVWEIKVVSRARSVDIAVLGGGFLYKMVRSIAGALLDVGAGKIEPLEIAAMLEAKKRIERVVSAPAKGLCLDKVFYRTPVSK